VCTSSECFSYYNVIIFSTILPLDYCDALFMSSYSPFLLEFRVVLLEYEVADAGVVGLGVHLWVVI
jgi:hypothetical protein